MSKTVEAAQVKIVYKIGLVLSVLSALVVAFLMNAQIYLLTVSYWARDELSGVLAPAQRIIIDVQPRLMLIGLMVVSAIFYLLALKGADGRLKQVTKKKVNRLRWVEYAVTGAISIELIGLLSGVSELSALKISGAIVVVSALLGWTAERVKQLAKKPYRLAYILMIVSGLLPWLLILCHLVATSLFGLINLPWFSYAAYATGVLTFISTSLTLRRQQKEALKTANHLATERAYTINSLVFRLTLTIILVSGLHR